MLTILGLRAFSLSEVRGHGISCGGHGLSVGEVPLLAQKRGGAANGFWTVRPFAELNHELTACYRLPVDVATKAGALALIANALNRGDLALAAIAAVQMGFPDPPPLAKGSETHEAILGRAKELHRSGLLKADWDPTKHPRTGTPPNPGRFAPGPKPTSVPSVKPRAGWPLPHVNEAAREAVTEAAEGFAKTGRFLLWGLPVVDGIVAFLEAYSPTELNQGEDRLTAQLKTALQPPKTLEELQQRPTDDLLGYEKHHIVNQNPDNLTKTIFEKFGSDRINDPSNIVWIPRLLHECVNAKYSNSSDGPGSALVREVINEMDFGKQRQEGLRILRECEALK
jgi:A nuclease family of the HNH/ENDO VII superfamily with conserved AHH